MKKKFSIILMILPKFTLNIFFILRIGSCSVWNETDNFLKGKKKTPRFPFHQ